MSTKERLFEALKTYFHFDTFRPLQEEIVTAIATGQDCLAILPTGGGKSLCFQLPGLLLHGSTIVISPLISLMTDQVEHLLARGISAVSLHSSMEKSEKEKLKNELLEGKYRFIYVSPETLASTWFKEHANQLNIKMVVVDEAHCISEWGDTFRPEYRQISIFVGLLTQRPVIAAFTASATPHTAADIVEQLQLKNVQLFHQSIIRSNLSLQVIPCETKTLQFIVLMRILKKHEGTAIILYGATRVQTESTAKLISDFGFLAKHYHGGLSSEERQHIQRDFLANRLQIICATTAFGMGVDKPNIRCVIHLTHPASLEHYYQEVGRAGRDGEESWCYMLNLPADGKLQHDIISRTYAPFAATEAVLNYVLFKKNHTFTDLYLPVQKNVSVYDFRQVLDKGEELGWWKNDHEKKTMNVFLSPKEIWTSFHQLIKIYNHHCQKLLKMTSYLERKSCRMRQLLGYFEPKENHSQFIAYTCKKCDHCLASTTHLPTQDELKNYSQLKKNMQKKLHYLHKHKLDFSLMGITLELLTTAKTYLQENRLPGIGRGWLEIIDLDEKSRQTLLLKTERSAQGQAFSAVEHQSGLDLTG